MKCSNCNAEWTVPPNISRSLTSCPFCGEALAPPKPKQLNTVEDVLTEITTRFGVDSLRNGQRMIALFSDLSPNMRRERLLLSYLIQAHGNITLLDARNKTDGEQHICFQQVCKHMVDEQFVAEDAARKICLSFSSVIGLKVQPKAIEAAAPAASPVSSPAPSSPKTSPPSTQSKATAPSTGSAALSKPAPAPGSSPRINTFAQYYKALEDYYLHFGKKPLSESHIRYFIRSNSLDHIWGITVFDVQKDLADIYAKYNPSTNQKKPATTPTTTLTFPANRQIHTYGKYLAELEQAYLRNGKVMLSKDQITAFLDAYRLQKNFGICISEVETDLREIAKKYS